MPVKLTTDITYAADLNNNKVNIENQQEQAIRSLKDRCPHIEQYELVVHYSKPRRIGSVETQRLSVECLFCETSSDVY